MSKEPREPAAAPGPKLSLDTWAVLLALLAVVLVRFGAIPHVPW